MTIAIAPKLLRHSDGRLYAYRGYNQIAYRFGRQIRIARVERRIGPFYFLGREFFEGVHAFTPAPGAKELRV